MTVYYTNLSSQCNLLKMRTRYYEYNLVISISDKLYTNVFEVTIWSILSFSITLLQRDRHGHDHMVVGFTTTYAVSSYHHYINYFNFFHFYVSSMLSCLSGLYYFILFLLLRGHVSSIQFYVIKCVSDL